MRSWHVEQPCWIPKCDIPVTLCPEMASGPAVSPQRVVVIVIVRWFASHDGPFEFGSASLTTPS
jgi:hypothetical protein